TTYSPTNVACSKASACTAGGLYYNYSVAGFFGVWAPSESGAPNADSGASVAMPRTDAAARRSSGSARSAVALV
ncbi:MAG TPA: hypothetical protein VG253_28980, partial [Streptosporangiaceae bacterium]|nr:hypothetical protein [Streptosporangiaceae bacterium]